MQFLTGIAIKLRLFPRNHVGGLLRDHDGRRIGVAGYDLRHDRSIDDTQSIESTDTQPRIDRRVRIDSRLTGAGRMADCLAVNTRGLEQFRIGLKLPRIMVTVYLIRGLPVSPEGWISKLSPYFRRTRGRGFYSSAGTSERGCRSPPTGLALAFIHQVFAHGLASGQRGRVDTAVLRFRAGCRLALSGFG